MTLPRISIQRPVLASMMSLALILFGVIGLSRLPVRELPDIDPPIVSVTTVYPGANAAVVETEVSERLEEEINNIEGIKTLTSQSREQVSSITIEFDLSRDIDRGAKEVRAGVSRVRGSWPDDIKEPITAKQDADAFPIIWLVLNSARYTPLELTRLAETQIKNRLQPVKGVSGVWIAGEQRFAMRLWLDSEKMAAHRVTVLDVQTALRQQNVELPSGRIENLEREMTIETRGELKTADQFNQLVLKNDGTKKICLRDIGRAEAGVENYRTVARNNGEPCVFLGVVKQSKGNTVEVAHGIKAEMERIRPTLPAGVSFIVNYDSSTFVERSIKEVWTTLGIAFGLVVLVIYLFLRDVRSTVIPAIAIPVSIVGTFAILYGFGYSVNILTMLALVLAIGVVVDDAIVVLENIFRHIEQGEQPMQAAFKAMDEITFALISVAVALVAVFAPLAFQRSQTGRLFIEFAVAVAGSVIISAFVALTLSPSMAARILKNAEHKHHNFVLVAFKNLLNGFNGFYRRSLAYALQHRLKVLGVGLASLGLMVLTYFNLEEEFLPEEDRGLMLSFINAPQGATSEYTSRMVDKVENILRQTPEVELFGSVVALAMNGPGEANVGIAFVHFKEDRKRTVQEIVKGPGGLQTRFLGEVEGAIAFPQIPKAFTRGFGAPFQLTIQSQDLDALNRYAGELVNQLQQDQAG